MKNRVSILEDNEAYNDEYIGIYRDIEGER